MSQNDFTIANQGFPAFRADLNSALQALASNSSGATAPSTTFANMWWYDSANNIMYIRNEDNDAWIKFAELDQTNDKFVLSGTLQLDDGTVSAPALTFNSDTNMGIYRGGTDILKFVTAGTDAITINASQDVTLAGSLNFADNEKAIFGAGSDLQIYHDTVNGNSVIHDAGSGNLRIRANDFQVTNAGATANLIFANDTTGEVKLYHNGSEKLATTSAGIDVTGLVVSDGMSTNTAGTSNFIAGVNAGNSIASGGNYNTAVGDEAGTALTTGDDNVAIGFEALKTEDTGGQSVAIGRLALSTQNNDGANYNVAIGHTAGRFITTGVRNTLIGGLAGDALTDADRNIAIGHSALGIDTQGSKSVAIGYESLSQQNFTSATDSNNTAVGYYAGASVSTGIQNTIIGSLAGDALTDADYNVAIGYKALSDDTLGSRSVAIGYQALEKQNFTSTTQTFNTAVGMFAGQNNITGQYNTFFGYESGKSATSSFNVAVGSQAMELTTSGARNTAVGDQALYTNVSGERNVAVGRSALYFSTGGFNTAVGMDAGVEITTGAKNTILGRYSGNQNGLDIRTSSNNILLSDGDGNPRQLTRSSGHSSWTNNYADSERTGTGLYHSIHSDNESYPALIIEHSGNSTPNGLFIDLSDADPDNNSQYFIKAEGSTGTERFKVWSDGDVVNHDNSYGAISDVKLKEQITDASSQWDDIKALTVRKYKMKSDVATGDSDAHWRLGLVAQEVETAGMNGLVKNNPDMIENEDGEIVDSGTTTKSIKYSILYMKAVKALQEAMERIETLEAKVATLEGE